ncbi:MAG: hypothetical protein WKF91_14955 [Segetibacter sp.]
MFKNYFKTAWRNLLKNKFYTSIMIALMTISFQAIKAALANPVKI